MTQVENDRRAAEILQQQLYDEPESSSGQDQLARSLQMLKSAFDSDPFADLRKRLQSRRCLSCNKASLEIDGTALIQQTREMLKRGYLHPCAFCPKCKGWSCIHCGGYHAGGQSPGLKPLVSTKEFKFAWCCDKGRLFLIFSLLCGLESTTPPLAKKPTKASRNEVSSRSTPAHSHLSKGTGYGDSDWDYMPEIGTVPAVNNQKKANDDTAELTLYFDALSSLLPSKIKATTPFDRSSQPLISEMIRRSPVFARASELLRHAAIEEINQRCRPIAAVLDFLETIAGHESTCPLLLHPRTLYSTTEQLPQIVFGAPKQNSRRQKLQNTVGIAKYDTSEPPAAVLEHLAIPVRKFVEASRRAGTGSLGDDYEQGESLEVLKKICTMADGLAYLRAKVAIGPPRQEPSSPPSGRPTANVATRNTRANAARVAEAKAMTEAAKAVSEWHRANCLEEVSDHVILNSFHFASEAKKAGESKPSPGRMRRLLAQVSSLSSDLPDGIYVRHGESRVDVMKVLIVGPSDTPYENGLFEFDLFCGPEFPQHPPQMFFRTTGNGAARFNPNLYTNGKICFSLLGTWRGQPWNPDQSTLLQLLVSIQAMVFNDQPYYNEPGYELRNTPAQAENYNRGIEALTVRYAMIPWLAERLVVPTLPANTQVKPDQQLSDQKTLVPPHSTTMTPFLPSFLPPSLILVDPNAQGYHGYMGAPGYYGAFNPSYSYPTPLGTIQGQSAIPMKKEEHHGAEVQHVEDELAEAKDAQHLAHSENDPCQGATSSQQTLGVPSKADDPIFGTVIREHFKLKASVIVTTVHKWEKVSPKGGGLSKVTHNLEKLLNQHGFND
ncbi:uncharacterized protein B0H64DRAFT_319468 [Chaetomium fimeti]|uniref:UBC core domain-containing protein n=1 Tax=Chaetomium fimeti TaxID=1854472 RepID=A0AAE0HIK8_9PEZI|nr:hypothetical protein B0H64DRAFT_319468 [Chaetomium fimeti]